MRESIELLTRRVRWLMFSISEQHSKGGVGWLVGVTPAKESSMGEDGFSLDGLPEFDFCKHFPYSLPIDSCNSARRLRWKEEMIGSTRRIHWVNHTANTYNRSEGKDGYTIVWTSCVWEWFAFEYHKLFVQNKLFCIDEISGKSTDSKSLWCFPYRADDANSRKQNYSVIPKLFKSTVPGSVLSVLLQFLWMKIFGPIVKWHQYFFMFCM